MDENPFLALHGMMKSAGEESASSCPRLFTGTVKAVQPLAVDCAGLSLSGDALRVNAALLAYSEAVSGTVGAAADCAVGSTTEISMAGTLNVTPALAIGDELLLLTPDYQKFYIICKVVIP